MPDRLPSLIVLVGCWVPPAVAGWMAGSLSRTAQGVDTRRAYAALATFVLAYTAVWFVFNLGRMPPYIPGATMDPTFASPRATAWLGAVAVGVVLPVSAVACALAFRRRSRVIRH